MTNEQIKTIILAIFIAVVSAFSKSIFDKIFAEYKPDTKKIVSRIKLFLIITLRYLVPIFGLISLSLKEGDINKSFVISFSFILFVLVLNIFFDVLFNFYDKNFNKERELFKPTFEVVKGLMDAQLKSLDLMEKIAKLSEDQLNLSSEIIEHIKEEKNNS
jgi:uncharacterized membrane protein